MNDQPWLGSFVVRLIYQTHPTHQTRRTHLARQTLQTHQSRPPVKLVRFAAIHPAFISHHIYIHTPDTTTDYRRGLVRYPRAQRLHIYTYIYILTPQTLVTAERNNSIVFVCTSASQSVPLPYNQSSKMKSKSNQQAELERVDGIAALKFLVSDSVNRLRRRGSAYEVEICVSFRRPEFEHDEEHHSNDQNSKVMELPL